MGIFITNDGLWCVSTYGVGVQLSLTHNGQIALTPSAIVIQRWWRRARARQIALSKEKFQITTFVGYMDPFN